MDKKVQRIDFEQKLRSLCNDCLNELIRVLEGCGKLVMFDEENDCIPTMLTMFNGIQENSYDIEFRAIEVRDGALVIYDENDDEYHCCHLLNDSELILIYDLVLGKLEELGIIETY